MLNEKFYFNPDDKKSLKYYEERSKWCNENNATIQEIGTVVIEEKTLRQFQIVAISEPTEEEKAERVRAIRNQYLSETDKYMLSDYPVTDEEREEYKAYRIYLRDITDDENFPNVEVLSLEEWKNE